MSLSSYVHLTFWILFFMQVTLAEFVLSIKASEMASFQKV